MSKGHLRGRQKTDERDGLGTASLLGGTENKRDSSASKGFESLETHIQVGENELCTAFFLF